MKAFLFLTVITTSILNVSCGSQKSKTYWVNSFKSECQAGEAVTQCIQISKSENPENATWENFYDPIEGYSFKPGVFQKIEVSETKIPEKDIQADASSLNYKLIKIVEEKRDDRYILNDIWAAKQVYGKDIKTNREMPYIEINVVKMSIQGKDGCNSFSGSITNLTANDIAFGPIRATKMYCGEDNISSDFNKALHASNTHKREGKFLVFYDNEANEMIRFIKVD